MHARCPIRSPKPFPGEARAFRGPARSVLFHDRDRPCTARTPRPAHGGAVHRNPREVPVRYQISGRQIDIGEALQTHVKTELGAVFEKYAGRPTDASVVFSRNAHE